MKAWLSALWVRNVIGTIVSAGAIGVLIFTSLGDSWAEYRHTVVPGAVVAAGRSGEADGQTWKIDAIRHLNHSPVSYGPGLPPDTVLTVITVDRTGSPPTEGICRGVITDGERRWKDEGIGGFQPPTTDGVTALCTRPGLLQFAFLLPRDAVPTAMDVVQFDGRITVRLLL